MSSKLVLALVFLATGATAVAADDAETLAMRRVRLTTDPGLARGCTPLGGTRDDSAKDLRRKIVRLGGDTAVVTFGVEDMSTIYAQVFRCDSRAGGPRTPPPPPGPPPPPPPGPLR